MRGHRFGVYAVALLGVLAVSPIAAQLAPEFPTLATDHAIGEGITQPCLDTVEGEAVCGRFRVLENRAAPAGRTIDVAFVVLKALDGGGRADAYTQFNGGPGSPMTPASSSMARRRADIRADRDVLLVDHRGTGNSTPLGCNNAYPTGMRSRFETVMPLDHVDGCRDMLSRRHDLSQYTTPNAMDDLAELSEWLGYAQLNINGGSYGTVEAQVFTRRHPDMVRTVIMNGVAPLQDRVYVHHARYLQESLENMYAECAEQPECSEAYPRPTSGHRRGPPDCVHPAPLGSCWKHESPVPHRTPVVCSPRTVVRPVGDRACPDLRSERRQLAGAGGLLCTAAVMGGHYRRCARGIPLLSPVRGRYRPAFVAPRLRRRQPARSWVTTSSPATNVACERWPSAKMPASFFEPVTSNKPVLILSGGRDPVTPVGGGNKIAEQWPNNVHVVVPNGGHGQGGPCITAMLVHLIRTGSVSGIDTSCVQSRPPTAFEISVR